MLFTSWRDEVTDLLGNCLSYKKPLLQFNDTIDEQMKCFAMHSEDLNAIQDQLHSIKDNNDSFNLVAPGTQTLNNKMKM